MPSDGLDDLPWPMRVGQDDEILAGVERLAGAEQLAGESRATACWHPSRSCRAGSAPARRSARRPFGSAGAARASPRRYGSGNRAPIQLPSLGAGYCAAAGTRAIRSRARLAAARSNTFGRLMTATLMFVRLPNSARSAPDTPSLFARLSSRNFAKRNIRDPGPHLSPRVPALRAKRSGRDGNPAAVLRSSRGEAQNEMLGLGAVSTGIVSGNRSIGPDRSRRAECGASRLATPRSALVQADASPS